MVLAGILVALLGLVICFRGIFIGKVFKAIFGAIQGAIYALFVQIILTLLRIASQSFLYFLIILLACIMAYLAAKKEELYKKIQGIINALLIGAVIGAVVYAAIRMQAYRNALYNFDGDGSSSNALAAIAGIAIVLVFTAIGAKWYKIFRRIGTLIIAFLIFTLLFIMYMGTAPALILAGIAAAIIMYLLSVYEKYIDFFKVSAIGAIITVIGALAALGKSDLISEIPEMLFENIGRVISGSYAYSYYRTETTVSAISIVLLSIIGMISQYNYVLAHTDNQGNVSLDWSNLKNAKDSAGKAVGNAASGLSNALSEFFHGISESFRRNKARLVKGLKTLVLIIAGCGVLVGIFYGGKALYSTIKLHREEKAVDNVATKYAKAINSAYGSNVISVSGATFVGAEGDGFDSSFNAEISGDITGSILATGISDPDTKTWYPDYTRVEIQVDNSRTEDIAKMFASVVSTLFNDDQKNCEALILDTLLYGDFTSEYSFTPWVEVDLGRSSNSSVQITLTDNGTVWTMTCGPKF